MKKYWKNAKKNWKSQGNSSVQKSGNHGYTNRYVSVGSIVVGVNLGKFSAQLCQI